VLNVIQNGAQAMQEGGTLEVVLEEDHKSGVLRITDEGPGIPEDIREKIFDLYFTTKSGGSGIGLAIDLPRASVAPRERGSTIKSRARHGIPLASSARPRDWGRRHLRPAVVTNEKGLAR